MNKLSRNAYPELIEILSNFSTKSFTELQAAAYIALISLGGEESGSAVAAQSGINRSKIYDILKQLEDIGAVKKVSREGKARYVATPPDELLPRLVTRFTEDIERARTALNTLKNIQEEVDPAKFTITTIDLNKLDVNKFEYLISSSEKSRILFTDKLSRDKQPSPEVKILNLNINQEDRGLVMLASPEEILIFGTPIGRKVESIHILSPAISLFIISIIKATWTSDLPGHVLAEIEEGQRQAFSVGKATWVKYDFYPRKEVHEFTRPVTYMLTSEHLSFFYEGEEALKIPLIATPKASIDTAKILHVSFSNVKGQLVGDLNMKTVVDPIYLKNMLNYLGNSKN